MSYTFRTIIEPDENGTFHAYVPALPGCHTWGETLLETRKNLREAILAYLESMREDGETVPSDTGFESFETVSDKEFALA